MWSKIKAYLRKIKDRTKKALQAAVTQALEQITVFDILAWFREAKYGI
jgi:hypothetical protein